MQHFIVRVDYTNYVKMLIKSKTNILPPYSPNLNPIEKYWETLKKKFEKITKNNKSLEESIYELFLSSTTIIIK